MRLFGFGKKQPASDIELVAEPQNSVAAHLKLILGIQVAMTARYTQLVLRDVDPKTLAAWAEMTMDDFEYYISNISQCNTTILARLIVALDIPFELGGEDSANVIFKTAHSEETE